MAARPRGNAISLAIGACLVLVATGLAWPAHGQVGASVTLASQDRYRGEPLSAGRPVAILTLAYDAPEGPYAGAVAEAVATAHSGAQWLSLQEYAGVARRLRSGLTLDAGLTNASYGEYGSAGGGVDYQEGHVGLLGRRFSAHLHYSPDYLGRGYGAVYAETSGVWTRGQSRLIAHVGLLSPTGHDGRRQIDWRLALAREFGGVDVQAAWVAVDRSPYQRGRPAARQALVLSVTRGF